MKIHLLHMQQEIKTGNEGRYKNEATRVRMHASLVSRPTEITIMVKLRLVWCPDPLTCEPD